MFGNVVCHQPTRHLGFYDAQNCLHSLTLLCGCASVIMHQAVYAHADVFGCVCCGFGRRVSDPAPFHHNRALTCFHRDV